MRFSGSTQKRQVCPLLAPEGLGCSGPQHPGTEATGQDHRPGEPGHGSEGTDQTRPPAAALQREVTEARICGPAFSVKGQTANIWALRATWPLSHCSALLFEEEGSHGQSVREGAFTASQ